MAFRHISGWVDVTEPSGPEGQSILGGENVLRQIQATAGQDGHRLTQATTDHHGAGVPTRTCLQRRTYLGSTNPMVAPSADRRRSQANLQDFVR